MASHLHLKPGSSRWHAVLAIPHAVRPAFGNKTQFDRSTKTSDRKQAKRIAAKMISAWRDEIDAARANLPSPILADMTVLWDQHAIAVANDPMFINPDDPVGSLARAIREVFNRTGGLSNINRYTLIDAITRPEIQPVTNRKATPFDHFLDEWTGSTHLRDKTKSQAISEIRRFARMVPVPIEQLSGKHIEVWIESMRQNDLSIVTIKAGISKVMSYWRWMERHEHVTGNPFLNRVIPDGRSAKEKHAAKRQGFTPDELHRLVGACQDDDLRNLILIGMFSGARRESIVTLKTDQIVTIRRIKCFHFSDKSLAGIRDTPVHTEILPLVDQMVAGAEHGYLFSADARGRNQYSQGDKLGKMFTRLKQKLEFPANLVFHSIRHSFAERLKSLGCHPTILKDLIGHATDDDVTEGYAKAASVELKREWLEKLHYAL